MNYWWDGAKIGLLLSLLAGPILIALVQTTIERGLRAGVLLGLGIWMSDAIFIQLAYFSLAKLQALTSGPWFSATMGTAGGILLIVFGVVAVWKKSGTAAPQQKNEVSGSSWLGYWVRGFLINTLNPFTFFFLDRHCRQCGGGWRACQGTGVQLLFGYFVGHCLY